ncbi:Replication protein A 70 kDa DNA-binding subunit C [Symbiodinium microadriaticum]|uniref:Replication protein A 70 kDa DNA-binding subunit C n=1 Tax=Symbiodinium microadriaticum TaxID=2951 RepID=A0A1Q9EBV1_SYMMI|nr:Replication protein A 70 kDa DNA-binding subunit C [Symbiodinium microadriaticum]CAE7255119.1 RPA1C [Symbiodinium microadriaticum]CAE7901844.1 RPA1C [Symbiodinium sp. KB8]
MYGMDGPGRATYTRGCLSQMLQETLDKSIKPVLIVKASAKIGNDQKRWSLTLCDGVHVVKSVVVSEMARRLEQDGGGNVIGLLLRLDKYGFKTTDNNSQILVVLEFATVGRAGPQDYVDEHQLTRLTREDVRAENIPSTQALHDEHSARFANGASSGAYLTPERRITPVPETTPNPPMVLSRDPGRMATFGQADGGNCGVADAPTQPGYVEAPAGPPANPYAMPPGGPYGGSTNPYANQSTASAPRPAETARNLSTSLAPVSSVGAVTPVSALNAYTGGRWKIKARVLTKGDVRKFNNQRGEGQLFKVDLGDKTGEISATFFGRAVDKYYSLLKPEKVYTFQKGQIKPANKRYDRGDHVLVFEEHALIELAGEDDDIPKISYDFRDLASVETLQPETHIDVKAVIFHVQEPFTFTAKTSNKEMTKRVLHLWDTSGDPASGSTCELTLWGDTALSSEFEMHQVIFLKKARVTEFNGQKSLSSPAGMQHSPDHPQAFALIRSYQQLQQANPQAFQARTNWGSSAGRRQTIEELRQEDIGLGAPPTPFQQPAGPGEPKSIHRHWVVATMTNLPMDRPPYYTACPHMTEASQPPTSAGQPSTRTCNKKVTQDGDGMWMCASGHKSQQPDFRYLCRLTVLDHTDKCEVNLYDEAVNKLLKCPAKDYAQVYDGGMNSGQLADQLRQLNGRMEWRKCLLRLRAQKEIWQENERVRYSVDEVQPVALVSDAKQMLADIHESLAAMPQAGY